MDGASRVFAAPVGLELGGRRFRVKGRLAEHYAEIEQQILSVRPDPIHVAKKAMAEFKDEPARQEAILRMAMDRAMQGRVVTRLELQEWLDTVPGTAFALWLSIRDNDPPVTLEWTQQAYLDKVNDMVEELIQSGIVPEEADAVATVKVTDALHTTMNQASGADTRGNSTGSSPTRSKAASKRKKSKRSRGGG